MTSAATNQYIQRTIFLLSSIFSILLWIRSLRRGTIPLAVSGRI